jgi:hypothetical protein
VLCPRTVALAGVARAGSSDWALDAPRFHAHVCLCVCVCVNSQQRTSPDAHPSSCHVHCEWHVAGAVNREGRKMRARCRRWCVCVFVCVCVCLCVCGACSPPPLTCRLCACVLACMPCLTRWADGIPASHEPSTAVCMQQRSLQPCSSCVARGGTECASPFRVLARLSVCPGL